MNANRLHRGALVWAALLGLAACGGDRNDTSSASASPPDTTIREQMPLTGADLAGLEASNLTVNLPWTTKSVTRSPTKAAARATLLGVETSEQDAFDRVVFRLSEDAPFPGYRVRLEKAGSLLACGDEEKPSTLGGEDLLTVSLEPARASNETKQFVPVKTTKLGQRRFVEGGLTCAGDKGVTWAAGLAQGSEVRIMELRNPRRLVVDVR